MATETFEIIGLDGALKTLQALPAEIVSKNGGPVRKHLRRAGVVLQKEAQQNVQHVIDAANVGNLPSKSLGLLKKSLIVTRGKRPKEGAGETVIVRVKSVRYPTSRAKSETTTQNMRQLEQGTEKRAPLPIMRRAFDVKKQEAVTTFTTGLAKELDNLVKKVGLANGAKF